MRVAVTGAAGQISNHLLFMIASGEVFGRDQPVALQLLGSDRSREALEGVAMELEDSLYPLLREVSLGTDPYKVFEGADWALLIGAKPRGPGMERRDLLDINGQIFAEQGKALNAVADRNCKMRTFFCCFCLCASCYAHIFTHILMQRIFHLQLLWAILATPMH